ncbi:MAG: tetratricopeptide repeat protein [Caulobacteraceae bacterium]
MGALALFVLSLWCKTVTATLPAALLVVFWWKRGRLEWRRDVLPVVPWIAVGAAGGLFTSWVERVYIGARGRSFATPFIGRVLVAGRAIAFYAGHLVWPFGLNFIYPRWTVIPTDWRQWLYPIGAAGFAGVLWAVRRRSRAPLAAYLLFVGALFPVLGFVNLYGARFSWVWDHWQYIADLAPLALASAGLAELWARAPIRPRWLGPMLATFIAVPLGLLTWTHCAMFGDDQTLYRATLARNPGCWLAHNNLGNVLAKIPGRLSDAIAQYEEALRIKPDYFEAHDNLANALAKIPGRLNDAIAQFDEALRLNPDFADAHDDLGNVLMRIQGRQNEAIAQFEEALRLNPDSADVHNNLGIALAQMPGRLNESIAQFKEVLRLEPDNVPVRENLGSILAEIPGRLDDAVAQYREALLLKPNDPMVHYNLGTILVRFPGRMNDAIFQFEQALRLDPGLADAHFNLAMAYLGIGGRLNDAIAQFEDSLRLRPDDPEARHYLALALSAGPGQGGPRGGSSPPAWK